MTMRDRRPGIRDQRRERREPVASGRRLPQAGFTLLEMVLVIAVLAILSAAITPALIQRILDARVDGTRAKAKSLYEAMVGRADDASSFGFIGDIGRLPLDFKELIEAGLLPLRSAAPLAAPAGWNGPYINQGTSRTDALTDDFGRPFTGAPEGQVRSAGPDGVAGTADDIVYPPTPPVIAGRLVVTVKTRANERVIVNPPNCQVRLFYPAEGRLTSLVAAQAAPLGTGNEPVAGGATAFIFQNIPMGLRSVQVACVPLAAPAAASGVGEPVAQASAAPPVIVAQETVPCPGGGRTKLVEIWY